MRFFLLNAIFFSVLDIVYWVLIYTGKVVYSQNLIDLVSFVLVAAWAVLLLVEESRK